MLLIIDVKKFHVLNFCCLAKPQNFFTIETFTNYGMYARIMAGDWFFVVKPMQRASTQNGAIGTYIYSSYWHQVHYSNHHIYL